MVIYIVIRSIHNFLPSDLTGLENVKKITWTSSKGDYYEIAIGKHAISYFANLPSVGGVYSSYIQFINTDTSFLEDLTEDEIIQFVKLLTDLAMPREAGVLGFANYPSIVVLKFTSPFTFKIWLRNTINYIKKILEGKDLEDDWWNWLNFTKNFVVFSWFIDPELVQFGKINKLTKEELKYLGIDSLIKKTVKKLYA